MTVLKVSCLHIFGKQQLNYFVQEKLRAWKRISLDRSALFTAHLLPVSCFPGVFLPLHRLCCLHHAAFLHERGHYCQCHHLPVAHRHAKHLSGLQSHRAGTFGLAGNADSVRQDCWNLQFTPWYEGMSGAIQGCSWDDCMVNSGLNDCFTGVIFS